MGPYKGGFGIVNFNPRRTYCPLVPKQYTFSATKGSPQKSEQQACALTFELSTTVTVAAPLE